MQRGNLIIYDNDGKIWYQSGEATGDILPHEYPNGLPYIEIPYGSLMGKNLIAVDVSTAPHTLITEPIAMTEQTPEERIQELENQILLMADATEGGIL